MVARMIVRDLDENPGQRQRLNVLSETLEDMTITMDAVVWAVNPKYDTLDGLANYLIRFTQEFFAGTPIRCELNIPPDLPTVPLTAAVRHNLFLAFKEALNNAAKHANPEVVSVQVEYSEGRLVLEVKDNGIGFDVHEKRSAGRGLENIHDRLKAIGGRCDVESTVGKGTRLRFEINLTL